MKRKSSDSDIANNDQEYTPPLDQRRVRKKARASVPPLPPAPAPESVSSSYPSSSSAPVPDLPGEVWMAHIISRFSTPTDIASLVMAVPWMARKPESHAQALVRFTDRFYQSPNGKPLKFLAATRQFAPPWPPLARAKWVFGTVSRLVRRELLLHFSRITLNLKGVDTNGARFTCDAFLRNGLALAMSSARTPVLLVVDDVNILDDPMATAIRLVSSYVAQFEIGYVDFFNPPHQITRGPISCRERTTPTPVVEYVWLKRQLETITWRGKRGRLLSIPDLEAFFEPT